MIAWIHSHVRGAKCNFSSIDNHTQYAYSKVHKGVLGLVIEIQSNGMRGVYDFFELTRIGKQTIQKCSKKPDCITTAQHESCSGKNIYQSASDQVCFDDFYTLNVSNFMSKGIENLPHEPILSHTQMEVEEFSDDEEGNELNDRRELFDERMEITEPQQKKKTECNHCKRYFINLFSHLSRFKDCREIYGKEFEDMKKDKEDKVRSTKRKRERNRRKQNTAKKRKENADYYSQNSNRVKTRRKEHYNENKEAERDSQRTYKSKNADHLKEDHRRYNKNNAPIINVCIFLP